ncbi:MAG: hypothetical protein CL694_04385 [Chloroflexi bacterium]|nr:hypothetical protein [Chloroflexota bacterium]
MAFYTSGVYPVQFRVDYPDQPLGRGSTFFRFILMIPIAIVAAALSSAGGILTCPLFLMIVFRQKYPRWWFDWNLALMQFYNRVAVYILLMRDEYPSTEDEQAIHLEVAYPDAQAGLNRFMPFVKWLLAIPHYIVLMLLWIGVWLVSVFAWFAILFTAKYPRGAFEFVEGTIRWQNRVTCYAIALTTDRSPPFRFKD